LVFMNVLVCCGYKEQFRRLVVRNIRLKTI
jgi:hypothetical protein